MAVWAQAARNIANSSKEISRRVLIEINPVMENTSIVILLNRAERPDHRALLTISLGYIGWLKIEKPPQSGGDAA
jgi:hypothetical protein